MKQDDLTQKVFMFEEQSKDNILDSNDNNTQIQKAIMKCPVFKDLSLKFLPTFKFFQIKKSEIDVREGVKRYTFQFIDISAKIFYDEIKAQEEFMSLITSTISHEMRNPLNSIIS